MIIFLTPQKTTLPMIFNSLKISTPNFLFLHKNKVCKDTKKVDKD